MAGCQPLTTNPWVQFQTSPCGICGRQSFSGAGFSLWVLCLSLPELLTNASCSLMHLSLMLNILSNRVFLNEHDVTSHSLFYLMTWLQAIRTAVLQPNYRTLLNCSIIRVCSKNTLCTSLLHFAFLALEKKTVRLKQMWMKWDRAVTHSAGIAALTAAIKSCIFWDVMMCHWASSSKHFKGL